MLYCPICGSGPGGCGPPWHPEDKPKFLYEPLKKPEKKSRKQDMYYWIRRAICPTLLGRLIDWARSPRPR